MRAFEASRVLTVEQADELVGTTVPDIPTPNVTTAGIWFDTDTGAPVLAYAPYPGSEQESADLRAAALAIPWNETYRSASGKRNKSRTFGMAPRLPVKQRESCRPTWLHSARPDIHVHLDTAATTLDRWVRENLPSVAEGDRETVAPVLPEWRVGDDTIWTSGVVNYTSILPYHRDGANFEAWSAMPVYRRGTRGGLLDLPEWGLTVQCRDGWVVYFAGWEFVHGVTPITKATRDGYRISIVYYSLRGMKDCHTFALEQAEGARRRTAREDAMLREGNAFNPAAADPTDDLW